MQTVLLVATGDTNNFHTPLDLYDDVPISIVIQEGDLSNFERRSNYSKTFRLPATTRNSEFFEHFYEVNSTGYNPLNSVPCVVQTMGNDVFKGTLRLNGVYRNEIYDEFEVYIIQELVDFADLIGNLNLNELDWSDLNHDLTYDNITTSWYANSGDTAGLFGGKILYPMINYGLNDPLGSSSFDYCIGSSPCFNNSGNALPNNIWKPAIRVKEVFDRIINYVGYQVDSDFINGRYFRSLYMNLAYADSLGVDIPEADNDVISENLNLFKVYETGQGSVYNYSDALGEPGARHRFRTLDPDGYDYLGNFNLNARYFRAPATGTYAFNIRFAYESVGTTNEDILFDYVIKTSTTAGGLDTGTVVASQTGLSAGDSPTQLLFPFTVTLNAGDYIRPYFIFSESAGAGFNQFQTLRTTPYDSNYDAPQWLLYSSPPLTFDTVDIPFNLPDMKAIDFLKMIIKTFNLVFLVSDERIITTEPFDLYFDDDNRTVKDWTQKLDISTDYQIQPFSFDLPRERRYTYESAGDERLGKYYEDNFNQIYGERLVFTDSNILRGEEILELDFRPTPTDSIDGSDWMIIPDYSRINDNGDKVAAKTAPHLFFWVGNRYCYTGETGTGPTSWYLKSGGTAVEQTTYPAVNHLSHLNVGQQWQTFSDLNFRQHWDYFANNNSAIPQFTKNNLYTLFHEQSHEEKYSTESRKFTGRFYLQPNEVGQINLTDKIYVKDSFYRIEKINEASLTDDKLTEVELIKDLGGFEFTTPPAPDYTVSPNAPFPTPSVSPSITPSITPTPTPSPIVYEKWISRECCDAANSILAEVDISLSPSVNKSFYRASDNKCFYLSSSTEFGTPVYTVNSLYNDCDSCAIANPDADSDCCNSHSVYGPSISQVDVCDQTAGTSTVYSNCTTLAAGCRVYTDSNCTTPVQVARFLYPTGAGTPTNIFEVIDTSGTLGTTAC